ncbi:AAA family ATPase [Candidatus Parabeggiatoa sp. HSG14]|uniref:ATP-binding protein n=1 Tax=Candidatus Parabeggiatoa sp. HSG14 TaxID=3055593 RepID=UPI0025A74C81|nr:AAA family ATPase [Thiotrichales bacterium HSG14]
MKKLPIGIQSFSKIIKDNCLYVDKTHHIAELIQSGDYIFLSRPRRFGKSLLVSTLYEIFSGNKVLFQGLAIYDKIEWQTYPVIVIDFNNISYNNEEVFRMSLSSFLDDVAIKYEVVLSKVFIKDKFAELIEKIHNKTHQKVVILVDEYDKPIVNYVDDIERAGINREVLKEFFSVLKSQDAFLRFVFLTGVSKFSRVSVFSELNNLRDITLSKQFATLFGYTQTELEDYFETSIQSLCFELGIKKPQLLAKIKMWYNGYSWNAKDKMYNPFSILNLFVEQRFSNYWFATGTPTFLMKLIKKKQQDVTVFENKKLSEVIFDSYNIESMNIFALLFQTGYLTITHIENKELFREYTLNYPNVEVKQAFVTYLMESFTKNGLEEIQPLAYDLQRYLQEENLEGFMNIIKALFAKIPYPLHIEQEAYYHSLFYMIAVLMGVEIDLEVLTDKGRVDGVLALPDKIYLIEFKYSKAGVKMATLTNQAIKQIRAKNYGERFLNDSRPLHFLGVGFTRKEIGYQLDKEGDK